MLNEKQMQIRKNQASRMIREVLLADKFKIEDDMAFCEIPFTYECLIYRINEVNAYLPKIGNPLRVTTDLLEREDREAINNAWLPLKIVMEL